MREIRVCWLGPRLAKWTRTAKTLAEVLPVGFRAHVREEVGKRLASRARAVAGLLAAAVHELEQCVATPAIEPAATPAVEPAVEPAVVTADALAATDDAIDNSIATAVPAAALTVGMVPGAPTVTGIYRIRQKVPYVSHQASRRPVQHALAVVENPSHAVRRHTRHSNPPRRRQALDNTACCASSRACPRKTHRDLCSCARQLQLRREQAVHLSERELRRHQWQLLVEVLRKESRPRQGGVGHLY